MIRRGLGAAGALLVAFHVWLFAGQVWSGALADPVLALRWLVGLGLVGAFAELYRRGEPLVAGRRAVSVWLLAAILHAPAAIERAGSLDLPGVPEAAVTLLQLGVVAGAGIALLRWSGAARPAPRARASGRLAIAQARRGSGILPSPARRRFAPRPPPRG